MRVCLTALFLVPLFALGQEVDYTANPRTKIEYYLGAYNQADGSSSYSAQVLSFVEKLDRKRSSFSKTEEFLEYIFAKTHQRFLKHYTEYASFGETLNHGTYNCLTGTALYALILDHFDLDYQVIETNYHIFLLTNTGEGRVLFETTDPINGFVSDSQEIQRRINYYKENRIQQVESSKTYYHYKVDLYNVVNLDQMLGLLHYNLSIVAYNQQNLPAAIQHLSKAMELHNSPRIEEFSKIILLSVIESNLEASVKEKCLEHIQSLRKKQLVVTASTN